MHELERAIAAEPDKLVLRYQLAQVLLLDKNVDAAEAALRAAVAQAPESAEAKLVLANLLAAVSLLRRGGGGVAAAERLLAG